LSDSIRHNPLVKAVLTPLSWLYGGITDFRNYCFDSGIQTIYKPKCLTLSVGNLTVGGTGKTPMIEWLIQLLGKNYHLAVISRGYGRETRGVVVAGPDSSSLTIGDEPLQFYKKFGPEVRVVVAAERSAAAERIAQDFPDVNLLLLDDAYQHRFIDRTINILLMDYNRPFYEDLPFPAGNLRERRKGASRADVVVVTKTPSSITPQDRAHIIHRIHEFTHKKTPTFFSSVAYGAPVPFERDKTLGDFYEIIGIAGLAQNAPFENFCRDRYGVTRFLNFRDHHPYSVSDLRSVGLIDHPERAIITTEKDMVKLFDLAQQLSLADRCFYVPIHTVIHESASFERFILSKLNEETAKKA
jgi:tetraacyldisaccharide 4'-kinase